MLKKILALVMVSFTVIAMFSLSGCGDNGNDTAKKKLGDVNVYSFYEPHFYNEDGSYDLDSSTGIAAKKYEEQYGGKVKVTVLPYADYASTLQNLIAAGTQPDMVSVYWGDMPNWGINILQPVDDYIDVKSLNLQDVVEAYSFDNKHYTLSVQQVQVSLLWYNRAIFERYGIEETPYELWKAGNWNWDKFIEIAKQLTQDLDGDGATDMYGFNSNDPQCYHYSNSAPFIQVDGDKANLVWDSTASINAFKMSQKMIYELKLQPENGEGIHSGIFENEQVAMASGTFEFPFFRSAGMDIADIGCAPFPTGSDFDGKYYATTNFYGLVQGAKNPEGAAALAKLIDEEGAKFELGMDLGNKDATDLLDDEAKEVIKYVSANVNLSMDRGWGTFVELYSPIYKQGNINTILDSQKQVALAQIEDTIKRLKK